jgi:serine protease
MRTPVVNRLIQAALLGGLAYTGWPLLQHWLPAPRPAVLPQAATEQEVAGQIVVDLRDDLTPQQLTEVETRYGIDLGYESPQGQKDQILTGAVSPAQQEAVLERLRHDPLVEAADRMHTYTLPRGEAAAFRAAALHTAPQAPVRGEWTPNDPRFEEQWNFKLIGAEKAWDRTRDKGPGKGVVVAVIDTGVAAESDDKCYHARDFKGTQFTKGYDFVNKDAHPNDDHGHGTHVAGTIAETTNNGEGVAGLAFAATVMPLKVLDANGSGRSSDIASAVRFAADHGARIINMSLGGPFPDRVMHSACQYAAKKGVLIVCAAGNSGGGPVGYPAAFPECLAVSSVGPKGEIAPYSSIGKEVAIAAPGGDKSLGEQYGVLQNTVLYDSGDREDDYFGFQGTSMASPHVAAAAALAAGRGVNDREKLKQVLQQAATPKKPPMRYGAGILNAAKTVEIADSGQQDSWVKLALAGLVGLLTIAGAAARSSAAGRVKFPWAGIALACGILGPDLLLSWQGQGSPFSAAFHSALIPLWLLSEAGRSGTLRLLSVLSLAVAAHLGWDAWQGQAPFAGVRTEQALPWMWLNAAASAVVALIAFRRSYAAR